MAIKSRADVKTIARNIVPGAISFLAAVSVSYLIYVINNTFSDQPERVAKTVGVLFLILFFIPPVTYILLQRRSANPGMLALIILTTAGVLLISSYLYWASIYLFFPADILLWSESDFVNDILKIRLGYPIYSAQENNESFVYTPGAQLLTYLLAYLFGSETSIPLWRIIQLGYVLLASIVAILCCRKLVSITLPSRQFCNRGLWYSLWLTIFFLMATNSITNPYVHNLHNDALGLLISIVAYWLLLHYITSRDKRVLALMACIPAAGFFVKQSLAIWALLYFAYIIFFDKPHSIKKAVKFAFTTFGAMSAILMTCYIIWGKHFIYWIFKAMGNDPTSPLRSLQHILTAWPYFAIGLLAAIILLRNKNLNQLLGAWIIWLFLILIEGATSGIGWMLNHMGPGSLIAGIWFLAALIRLWPSIIPDSPKKIILSIWLRTGIIIVVMCLLYNGLGFVRAPVKHLSDDTYRYVKEIEREFEGQPTGNVLIDAGTWMYLKDNVIMKDRGIAFGNRGLNGSGDFSGMIRRIKHKHYRKILVRNLQAPIFFYDHWLWPKSSGIKQALLENYHENGKIEAVEERVHEYVPYYFFDEITILVPNQN